MSVFSAGTITAVRREPPAGLDGLERLESVAEALVRQSAPARFSVARTEEERTAIFRLRHRVVMERKWACPDEFPEGIERDHWDDGALHVGGTIDGELIACARLVLPRPGYRLPVEAVFDLTVAPAGKAIQVDRVVVAREIADPGHLVLIGLAARCWLEAHARGCHVFAGINSRMMTRLYRTIGLDVEVLGPGRHYWGEERFPVRVDTAAAAEAISAIWERALGVPIGEARSAGA
jgi:N-acyl-L-homoserine lactone synthetase